MDVLHQRLLRIGFDAGDDLGLVLAGGYALSAHNLVNRPSRDIDFATATALPLPAVTSRLVEAYIQAGFTAKVIEAGGRMARLLVTGEAVACEVDLLKEAIGPPATLSIGPVLALEDAIGLKVRALHDRAAHRDYIDIRAANQLMHWSELEHLGARHTAGFSLEELADRLGGMHELDTETFASYGLTDADTQDLAGWASRWEADIRTRLANGEVGPSGVTEDDWESYLDEP
ncbi:nucleotidyl transferase AbiEii/AbiGii toxin family protein [Micromonospora sp. R77]|uniref:nucleotidyl transferase AbiEii/AbiGii toxin family protein n=1 Tax=Micromonospora sp. R77 TaxID=2925836 RepID=UPI001F61A34B|nr:nucleotidyl transferase AbiEii/AbiGii toxin family protein [Micromonospora sp. R77]MCI4064336.1 nucleotidyl transferase AbiEii/AbiGii toxin family protein [Micromonospora sp. R77]